MILDAASAVSPLPGEGLSRRGNAQVLVWVLSYDGINSPEPLAITAAAAALSVSGECAVDYWLA